MYRPLYSATLICGNPPPKAKPRNLLPDSGSCPCTLPKIRKSRLSVTTLNEFVTGLKLTNTGSEGFALLEGKQNSITARSFDGDGTCFSRTSTYSRFNEV